MNYEFKSLKELYDRITPALRSKVSEFKKIGYKEIKESDIWNYLTDKKWQKSTELTLSEIKTAEYDNRYSAVAYWNVTLNRVRPRSLITETLP